MKVEWSSQKDPHLTTVHNAFSHVPRGEAFNIAQAAPILSQHLQIDAECISKILSDPRIFRFDDVDHCLEEIVSVGSVPIVWTQGNVANHEFGKPFQLLKAEASGVLQSLCRFVDIHTAFGFDPLIGSPHKTDDELLGPVIEHSLRMGLSRIVVADDQIENLLAIADVADTYGIQLIPHHIKRIGDFSDDKLIKIHTLHDMKMVPDSLYMLDLDRTLIDTDAMKLDWMKRLAALLPFEPPA